MMTITLTFGLAALVIGIAVLLLGVKVFFVKGGKFPTGHAHENPELKRRGIGCHHDL